MTTTFIGSLIALTGTLSHATPQDNDFMLRAQYLIQPNTSYTTYPLKHIVAAQKIVSMLREEGIPISAIAEIAKVERKTIYSWLEGGAIRLENQKRLEKIYELLFPHKVSLLYLYRYWNEKIQEGNSINDLLKEKTLNTTEIRQALSILWPLAEKYYSDLAKSYIESNEDVGQQDAMNDWNETSADGFDEW